MNSLSPSNRRAFLARLTALGAAFWALPALNKSACAQEKTGAAAPASGGPFQVPPLAYGYDALEPHIDEATMKLHHDKHHQSYVDKVNKALEKHPDLQKKPIQDLIRELDSLPEEIRSDVRNHGGGHYNHSLFWESMTPKGSGKPEGELAKAIDEAFGSFEEMTKKFNDAGAKQFGSGWAWLVADKSGKLAITSTPNQDNPLSSGKIPLLGNDVWEHAYYLKYQNKRADYLAAWWNVVDWKKVAERYAARG